MCVFIMVNTVRDWVYAGNAFADADIYSLGIDWNNRAFIHKNGLEFLIKFFTLGGIGGLVCLVNFSVNLWVGVFMPVFGSLLDVYKRQHQISKGHLS